MGKKVVRRAGRRGGLGSWVFNFGIGKRGSAIVSRED